MGAIPVVGIDITGTHKSTHCNNSTHAAHNGLSCAPPSKQSSIVPATRFRSSVIHADIIHEMSASLVDMHEKVGYIPAFVPTSGYLQHANAYAALSAGSLPLVCSNISWQLKLTLTISRLHSPKVRSGHTSPASSHNLDDTIYATSPAIFSAANGLHYHISNLWIMSYGTPI